MHTDDIWGLFQTGIIKPFIGAIIGLTVATFFRYKWLYFFFNFCRKINYNRESDKETIRTAVKYYVPNDFKYNGHKVNASIIEYFINQVFSDKNRNPYYLVLGPTGIGKTTFTINLYAEYAQRKYRVKFKAPSLILGRIYDDNTWVAIQDCIDKKIAKHTILLLDALDELEIEPHLIIDSNTIDTYWSKFQEKWINDFAPKLKKFRKVIITIRQQFLISKRFEEYPLNDKYRWQIIELQPFDLEKRNLYLLKRYGKRNSARDISNVLNKKFHDIMSLPLVLNNLSRLANAYNKIEITEEREKFFASYNVYKLIVDDWLDYEKADKVLDKNKVGIIRNFCKNIAIKFINQKEGIPITSIEKFENDNTLSLLLGLQDRSLLIKSGNNLLRFAHETFQEYFFAEFLLSEEIKESSYWLEQNGEINLDRMPFTMQIVIGKRWFEQKKHIKSLILREFTTPSFEEMFLGAKKIFNEAFPHYTDEQIKKYIHEIYNEEVTTVVTIPTKNFISEFYSLIYNLLIDVNCQAISSTVLFETIKKEDFGWEKTLEIERTKFWITDEPILEDGSSNISMPFILFATFYSDYIVRIQLGNNSYSDEVLSCFSNCNSIEDICIRSTFITGSCLNFFCRNEDLRHLHLTNNKLVEKNLLILEKFNKLEDINLDNSGLTGCCLASLKNSAKTIFKISLANNPLNATHLENLLQIEGLLYLNLKGCFIKKENAIIQELILRGVDVLTEESDGYRDVMYVDNFGRAARPPIR